ncbi:MAG: response regulator [Ramlibacter sp.]|nr:response regulator transcription factor [Ramlibacter sp.]
MNPTILLADDHSVMRFGLRALLEMADMKVVAEAADGREALRLAQEHQPDVAIFDIAMPGLNGIEATGILKSRCPNTRVVILSMHSDSEHVHRALTAGAAAYVLKGGATEEIVTAVRTVCAGRQYLSRALAAATPESGFTGGLSPLDSLSARERQVLQLVAEGHSSAQIAALVHLSPKSIDTYRSRLMRKLGVADLAALIRFAVQHGLTPGG